VLYFTYWWGTGFYDCLKMKLLFINNKIIWNNFFYLFFNVNFFKLYILNNSIFLLYLLFINKLYFNFLPWINFVLQKKNYYFIFKYFYSFFQNIFVYFFKYKYLEYRFFKFFIFVGLGFRRRRFSLFRPNHFFLYFGHRHWITFLIPHYLTFIYVIRRRSFAIFSKQKFLLKLFISNFKLFSRENAFKIKGFLDIRSKRRWLFMRRLKIRGIKLKLSKKQKFL